MSIKAVDNVQNLFRATRPLRGEIDKLTLLRRSRVDFIPLDNHERTIRTTPLLEDNSLNWRQRYTDAAIISITNPLCFSAQNLINDELADCIINVEEKQGTEWVKHENNSLFDWIDQPNPSMDMKEYLKAYSTHLHTFGAVYSVMFQQKDILPNGKINLVDNNFDIIFPARIAEDTVSNPYGVDWYYQPIGNEVEDLFKINSEALFIDVIYNPIGHNIGIALPTNPLNQLFKIHRLYMNSIERFFTDGAVPRHILTRIIDMTKEAAALSVTDEDINDAVQRIYSLVGQRGARPGGILGLRGDWKLNKLGSDLPELMNKDLLQYIDAGVQAVYKIPSSLFWAGMQAGGQRASRQQDSIDFYNQKIKPLRERMFERLSKFLVPRFLPGKTTRQFRISADVSESGLAQYANTKEFRMYERWFQQRIINRGKFLNWVGEDTSDLTEKEKAEMYIGAGATGMSVGGGDQNIEGGAGGGGGGGTAQGE